MKEKFIIELAEKYFSKKSNKLIKGIGDDTAVFQPDNLLQLFTSDMLVEDTHFILDKISPYDLGWKSLAVNISDIASMGGYPTYANLSLGINEKINEKWLDSFYQGMSECAEKYNMFIVGGDTVFSKNIVINISLLGNAKKAIYRTPVINDYVILSTGELGLSGAGLDLILNNITDLNEDEKYCLNKHTKPIPRVEEGIFLANINDEIAMMDCSDGLYTSVKTFSELNNLGVELFSENIEISENLKLVAEKLKKNPLEYVLYGGEDYELIFAIPENNYLKIAEKYFSKFKYKLKIIGKFTDTHSEIRLKNKSSYQVITDKSFQHF